MKKLAELQARQAEIDNRQKAIFAQANSATAGELTEAQRTEFDALESEYAANESAIKKCEQDAADAARIASRTQTRVSIPAQTARTENPTSPNGGIQHIRITNEVMSMEQIRGIPAERRPEVLTTKNGGFRSLGEQLQAIANAEINGNRNVDDRLYWEAVTPSAAISGAGSSVPADGGYLVQKDVMSDLNNKAFNGGELLSRVDRIPIGAGFDGLKVNAINETSRASGSRWGGVQMYWGAEADAATAKKPTFRQDSIELVDLIGLAYITERLLQDAVALGAVYSKAFMEESIFMKEDGIYNGTGAGQIQGFMNSPAKVAVTRTTASRVKYQDIVGMWARMWSRSRPTAVWLINQDIEPDLFNMQTIVQNVAGTENVGGSAAYMPPGGLNDSPYARLMGRPVIPVEYAATLGTSGDIALVDLSEFAYIHKGNIQTDSSIHVRFIYNERAYRWVERCNGKTKWVSAVTPYKGSATKSPFIVLS